jgi:hypothetical protein
LTSISPPDMPGGSAVTPFAVGLASFVALVLLLFIQALSSLALPARWGRVFWIGLAGAAALSFMITSVNYFETLEATTFFHMPHNADEPVRYVLGAQYTPRAQRYVAGHPDISPEDLLQAAGKDDPATIWTRRSIAASRGILLKQYQFLVISLSICLFSLLAQLTGGKEPIVDAGESSDQNAGVTGGGVKDPHSGG